MMDIAPSNLPSSNNWFAVHTRSKCEKVVEASLAGFCTTYLPMQTVRRQWSDRVKQLELPLIPSYLFVKGAYDNRLTIYRHPNVYEIVNIHGKLLPIPEKEIETVRKIEASRMPFRFQKLNHQFPPRPQAFPLPLLLKPRRRGRRNR